MVMYILYSLLYSVLHVLIYKYIFICNFVTRSEGIPEDYV